MQFALVLGTLYNLTNPQQPNDWFDSKWSNITLPGILWTVSDQLNESTQDGNSSIVWYSSVPGIITQHSC